MPIKCFVINDTEKEKEEDKKKEIKKNDAITLVIDSTEGKIGVAIYEKSIQQLNFLEQDYKLNKMNKDLDTVEIINYLIETYRPNDVLLSSRMDFDLKEFIETKLYQQSRILREIEVNTGNRKPVLFPSYKVNIVSIKHFSSKKLNDSVAEVLKKDNDTFMNENEEEIDNDKKSLIINLELNRQSATKITFGCVSCILECLSIDSTNLTLTDNTNSNENDETNQHSFQFSERSSTNTILNNLFNYVSIISISDDTFTMDEETIFSLQLLPIQKTNYQKSMVGCYFSMYELLGQYVKTDLGKDLLMKWLLNPLKNVDKINKRLDFIENCINSYTDFSKLNSLINKLPNMKKIISDFETGKIHHKTWLNLYNYFSVIFNIELFFANKFAEEDEEEDKKKNELINEFSSLIISLKITSLTESILLFLNIEETFLENKIVIKDGFNSKLDEYREVYNSMEDILAKKADLINNQIITHLNTNLKIAVLYVPQLGYLISMAKKVFDPVFLDDPVFNFSLIFDTDSHVYLKNNIMQEMDSQYGDIFSIISDMEMELILNFQNEFAKIYKNILLKSYDTACKIEVLLSFSEVSLKQKYQRPVFENLPNDHMNNSDDKFLEMINGRHPLYENINETYIPNTHQTIADSYSICKKATIITGANMSGKTIYMLSVGLNVIMAQIGCFVAADSFSLSPVDKILSKIYTRESVIRLHSNFFWDCQQLNKCLQLATKNSLLLIDEFGKGTDVIDGPSLFGGILETLTTIQCRVLLCTHFHELFNKKVLGNDKELLNKINFYTTEILITKKQEQNNIASNNDNFLTFLYKVKEGISFDSFGVICAEYCGMNKEIVDDAKKISKLLTATDQENDENISELFAMINHQNEKNIDIEYQEKKKIMMEFLKTEF
ncbi:hypothetical protein ACO0SA_003230 [Hanseniaspora valbyensis]